MVVKKAQKKAEEKGVGYVLEAFVAAIVLFIFAFSHHAEAPQTRNWNNFQDQVGANDLTYVMEKTGHTENMIRRGQTGSLQTAFSGATGNRISVSGTVENTPVGNSRIGFYTPESDIYSEDLVEVSSGDRCYNELEELNSERPILRTQDEPGSLENIHGYRIYIADLDPTSPVEQNNQEDYDTFWVDKGAECNFRSNEGPNLIDSYFRWGDGVATTYDFKDVNSESNQAIFYNASKPAILKQELRRPQNVLNIRTQFDSFNFSKENLNYDLMIMRSSDNLEALNENEDRILEYQKDGSLLLMMNLEQNDLNTGFLSKTGLRWVDLERDPDQNTTTFVDSTVSEKANEYLRSLRCDDCRPEIPLGGTISSSNGEFLTQGSKLLVGSNTLYQTEEWNSVESSMSEVGNVPEGLPQNNCGATTQAEFEFPSSTGETSTYTVYNFQLGSESQCTSLRGIGIDLDNDGDFTDPQEATHVSGDEIKINQRLYRISIESENEARFSFNGDSRVEFVNYRTDFPNHDIQRFGRMGDLFQNKPDEDDLKAAGAITLWMLENNRKFGRQTTSPVETKAIGGITTGSYFPYKIYLRWSN